MKEQTELQEELQELQDQLLGNKDGMIYIESKVDRAKAKRKPSLVSREPREIEIIWDGELVKVDYTDGHE